MSNRDDLERTGVGDEYPSERAAIDEPGLSGGEFPGSADVVDAMSEAPLPEGQSTTFGGTVGDYGPGGTMGTIDEGNAVDAPSANDDTQFGLGPERQ